MCPNNRPETSSQSSQFQAGRWAVEDMNGNPRLIFDLIHLGAFCAFCAIPFLRLRVRAMWANWIIFTIAGLFLIMAVSRLALDLNYWSPFEHVRWRVDYWMQGTRGIILGSVLVLLVSRQLLGKRIAEDKDDA